MTEREQIFRKDYSIDMNLVTPQSLFHFKLAGDMLPVVDQNNPSGQSPLHAFPGRGINGLVAHYSKLLNVVRDTKYASLVLEYWDSENERPVAWLYPTGRICASSRKLESDMNSTTYADLQQQLKLRNTWMQMIKNSK